MEVVDLQHGRTFVGEPLCHHPIQGDVNPKPLKSFIHETLTDLDVSVALESQPF